jgi:hypothetical protein
MRTYTWKRQNKSMFRRPLSTRTDKEIHIETADISSKKERPCQLMQKWYHPI